MTSEKKTALFETMPIPKAVATLAVPTIISSVIMVLYNLADTYFVGAINDPVETAAVTLGAPALLAFNAIVNLFGVGSGSLMSRALGQKDYDTVRRTAAYGFYGALIFSLLYSVACTVFRPQLLGLLGADADTAPSTSQYLFWTVTLGAAPSILNLVLGNLIRSEGESLHASIGTISGCLLNIVLDPLFIMPWGLDMGASGAGCATFLANSAACLYFFVFLIVRRGRTYVSIRPRDFRPSGAIVKAVAAVGVPAAVQNLLNVTGMTVLNNFTSGFGTDAVAAMGIAHKINMVPMYFTMGLGQGIMPLVGYNYSSGNSARMKKAVTFTAKISAVFIVAATAAYYLGAEWLITLFMKNESIIGYGTDFLRGYCLSLPFLCVDFLAVGIFQAVGMGGTSFIFAILRKGLLEIPAYYILNRLFPLYGLPYGPVCSELVLSIVAVFVLARLFRRADAEAEQKRLAVHAEAAEETA